MTVFSTSEDIYNFFSLLLPRIASHPEAGAALQNSGLILTFRLTEPAALVTVDTRSGPVPEAKPLSYFFGECDLEPELTLEMTAAALDELWSGRKDIFSSMLAGKVKITGKVAQAARLVPVLKAIPPLYGETLNEFQARYQR